MRFARTGVPGAERPIVSGPDGLWRDLTPLTDTIDTDLVTSAECLDTLPVIEPERFGPPLGQVGKIVCIGLNYADHARETGATRRMSRSSSSRRRIPSSVPTTTC
jgi:2-keto-4-pentenoate hydratase/2-oxohepta-3-ene-1,7-dioic acid hydratase in catechol pathway